MTRTGESAYEDRAYQRLPHVGAWLGKWAYRPGQRNWLGIERAKRTAEVPGEAADEVERPDEELRRDVVRLLAEYDAVDHTTIEVEVGEGRVVLRGTVEHAYQQIAAQRVALAVPGVRAVHNSIVCEPAG